jgi:hypothetical protein
VARVFDGNPNPGVIPLEALTANLRKVERPS